jgi:hypothetical protein
MSNLTNTKSLLAKLLASENLTIEHGNYPTASMDVKNRILRLPIWKEMSGSLYDLMVLHEVGHALYTPEDGWHESASNKGNGYKSFLNVVEDARIERKIKDKYPGGRRSFVDGYLDLIKKDFFGLAGLDPNELNLIDRINLHFKGGSIHGIEFSEEELEFVEKVKGTRTWEDVVRVTDELYEYAKEHDSETDMSDHSSGFEWVEDENDEESEMDSMGMEDNDSSDSSDSFEDCMDELKKRGLEAGDEEKEEGESGGMTAENEGEKTDGEGTSAGDSGSEEGDETSNTNGDGKSDEPGDSDTNSMGSGAGVGTPDFDNMGKGVEPRSMTDDNFREREGELVSTTDAKIHYGNLPIANLKDIIIDYKEIHKVIRNHYETSDESSDEKQLDRATKLFVEFRSKNKKTVEYLAKEFEMKKAADAHSRTATANSGIIDTGMLHEYKYNENIFKKINVTSDGKNHGLVMVVDWSGSMGNNIKGTIEQMMVLVMFAKRVNIPFEVFLFSDSYPTEIRRENRDIGHNEAWTHKDGGKNGDLIIDGHHLLNVFSSRMRANELHSAYVDMTAIASSYDREHGYYYYHRYRTIPSELSLGGTPLNASLLAINTFVPEFKAKNNVQIVNLIYLTDGDSSGGESIWNRKTVMEKTFDGDMVERYYEHESLRGARSSEKIIIRDLVTKDEYEMADTLPRFSRGRMTNLLVEVLRNKHNVNVVNFFIIPKLGRYEAVDFLDREKNPEMTSDQVVARWRREGHIIAENYGGWSELYLIKGGRSLDVEEPILEVKEDAKKGEIKRAFSKFNKGKLKNRLVLSKFVDMIAA